MESLPDFTTPADITVLRKTIRTSSGKTTSLRGNRKRSLPFCPAKVPDLISRLQTVGNLTDSLTKSNPDAETGIS
jgi:hypothetical protein